ncbi:MAG: F0F1 ATP synthase subunit B [Anaerolineales bacterium]|nr:F0F1 ATP synthase subunit B [Anaerolineales bacterium]
MEKLGLNLGTLLLYTLNFAVLVIILRAWVFKPAIKALEERQKKIADGLYNAEVAAAARAKAESEAQHIINQAQQETARKLREAADNAERASRETQAAAEKETAAIRDAARKEALAERDRILAEVRPKVAALAIAAAHKLIGESLDEKRQRALVDEFFSGVRDGKVVLLEEGTERLPASGAEVVSALPLSETEQNSIRKEMGRKAGVDIPVAFGVDPNLLGGLKIRVGDRVIDGSVAGQIENLRKTLL